MAALLLGLQDVASALSASVAAPQAIRSMLGQPLLQIPRYIASLRKTTDRARVNAFGKGDAACVENGDGLPSFAELVVLKRLRFAGWNGFWRDSFGRRCIDDWPWDSKQPTVTSFDSMPNRCAELLDHVADIRRQLRGAEKCLFHGMPDIVAWRENDFIALECKRANRDRLRRGQEEWFQCAILAGLTASQLGIFEWHFEPT